MIESCHPRDWPPGIASFDLEQELVRILATKAAKAAGGRNRYGKSRRIGGKRIDAWPTDPQQIRELLHTFANSGWIKRGALRAINTAAALCGRPRWVIMPEDLAVFENNRLGLVPPKPRRTRQPKMPPMPDCLKDIVPGRYF